MPIINPNDSLTWPIGYVPVAIRAAYHAGVQARALGTPIQRSARLYPDGEIERETWEQGWMHEDARQIGRLVGQV